MKQRDCIIHEIHGPELEPWLDALGTLRIRVFREYPYLYDGTLEYERDYLRVYQNCPRSRIVLVTTPDGALVGATTCMPLADEGPEFQEPFLKAGLGVDDCLYFGESIVLPEWRGFGLGKEFFLRREAHARRLGLGMTAFCAVDRPEDHPLRPPGYRPLDAFWSAQGYVKQPSLQAVFTWKETCEETESPKTLTFWTKTWKT
jgi:GNAT superfamily N-acetyltransferase